MVCGAYRLHDICMSHTQSLMLESSEREEERGGMRRVRIVREGERGGRGGKEGGRNIERGGR